ncbi:hypothetical protein [Metabacillus niabensis]|uniref:hypothetical protein n=1 Tax=Metabacillus niabensis TaxID=324854 RepID=UPI001CFA78AF|nr:hypothetical protein [Metabacillus niabensis]
MNLLFLFAISEPLKKNETVVSKQFHFIYERLFGKIEHKGYIQAKGSEINGI